jgi:hypothetical protein
MSLVEHFFKVLSLFLEPGIRIQIRIKVKGRIRIRIKEISRIRIRIKVYADPTTLHWGLSILLTCRRGWLADLFTHLLATHADYNLPYI